MGKLPFRQVHLDFHTSELIENIGGKFNKKEFQDMLTLGHVNSITIFAKCHHGWAYHETSANEMHPYLNFDLLDAMIGACREIGVKTPVYISAGLDEKIVRDYPHWLTRNKDDSAGWAGSFLSAGYHLLCFNSPYLEILKDQCREVAQKFKDDVEQVNGIFLDICSPRTCYCQNCVKILRANGKDPRDDAAVKELGETTYKKYYTEINKVIHDVNPNFRIFHNGGHLASGRHDMAFANTHLELESLPTGGWGYDHFPMSARYAHGLGLEFLGMTGKFHTTWGEFGGYKHPNALKYEAALSIANGAKCSIGDQMHPEGFLDKATYELIGAAYSEVEKVEEYCDDVENIADVALLCDDYYASKYGGDAYRSSREPHAFVGATRMMLEGKYLYDIIDVEIDADKLRGYKVVILPDCMCVTAELKAKLAQFTAGGGQILASGVSALDIDQKEFVFDFGAGFEGKNEYKPTYLRPEFKPGDLSVADFVMYGDSFKIKQNGGKTLAYRRDPYFNRDVFAFCSHQHTPADLKDAGAGITQGKDGIYIAWSIFADYATKGALIAKETVKYALDTLLGEAKTFKSNMPSGGVVTLMKQPHLNRYVNHLLYASPVKRGGGIEVIEDILPLYDVSVELTVAEPIKKAYDAKTKEAIAFTQNGGSIKFCVDKLDCHKAVVLEY